MKSLVIAFGLFAGASVVKITFDVWDLFVRADDCMAVQQVGSDRDAGLVYKGDVPCPMEGR